MLSLSKSDLWYIKEVGITESHFYNDRVEIVLNYYNQYGFKDQRVIARIFNNYTLTYINGIHKEYKRRKAAINAIIKAYNSIDKMDKILAFKEIELIEKIDQDDNINIEEIKKRSFRM